MVTEKTLTKFGFIKDENNSQLMNVLKNNIRLKEIHIDTYPENPLVPTSTPFMLLLRTTEKNVIVSNNEGRIILKKNDRFSTHFFNVLLSEITGCCCKVSGGFSEFVLSVQNIYYKITVFN